MRLISESYRKQNQALHEAPRGFGAGGGRWAGIVKDLIVKYDIESMIDYGCGQSNLYKQIKADYPYIFTEVQYKEYDPCIPGKNFIPGPADLVTCTDVIEHVEPECLNDVLTHIFSLSTKVIFLNISLKESNKCLPDGRNSHLIVKRAKEWRSILSNFKYNKVHWYDQGKHFNCIFEVNNDS